MLATEFLKSWRAKPFDDFASPRLVQVFQFFK